MDCYCALCHLEIQNGTLNNEQWREKREYREFLCDQSTSQISENGINEKNKLVFSLCLCIDGTTTTLKHFKTM